ncbi:MAG: YdgA family protein [Gammaproteobacteria bacterium]|nr:YdgA family protein [Gammaproteobacteria bacterium]
MKKFVVAVSATLFVILLIAALALPFWFGQETEKTYHALLERLSRDSGVQLTPKSYTRGWLTSEAETSIRYPGLALEIVARHHIIHGPIPIDRLLNEFRFTPVQARIVSQLSLNSPGAANAFDFPPLTSELTFQLSGDGKGRAQIAPVKKTTTHGDVLDWRGIDADFSFDREFKKFRFDVRMPSLNWTMAADKGVLSLSQLSLRFNMHEGVAGYFFGDGAFRIGQLGFDKEADRFSLQGMEISSSAQPDGDNVNFTLRYKLEEARVAQERFGPAELSIEAHRLDAAALVKFKKEVDAIYRGNLPPAQANMMVTGKTLNLLATLAKKGPELEITRLSFNTPDGDIRGQAKFVLDGRNASNLDNPLRLLTALNGELTLSIPRSVLKRALAPAIRRDLETYQRNGALSAQDMAKLSPQAMNEIIDRAFPQYLLRNDFARLLVEQGDAYKFELSIKRGQLLVNGKVWHNQTRI